jgi:hypothetical protein
MSNGHHRENCVCTVCTCGRHHCPPPVAEKLPFEGNSTSHLDYDRKPLPGKTARPPSAYTPGPKFEGTSRYQDEFTAKEMCPFAPVAQAPRPAPVPFEGQSTSRSDYDAKPLPGRTVRQGPSYTPGGRFEGESEYHRDFRPPSPDAYARPGPAPHLADRPHIPFEGITENRAELTPKPLPERVVRPGATYSPGGKFEGESESHRTYAAPGRDAYARPGPAPHLADRPHIPFEGTTESRDKLTPKPLPGRTVRQGPSYTPGGRFEGESEYHRDFRPPSPDAYARPGPAPHLADRPHIPFQGTTENRAELTAKPLPERVVRPGATYSPGGKFEGESEYHRDFRPPSPDAYARPGPAPHLADRPHIPFEGITENRAELTPKPLPERVVRPGATYTPGAKFEGESEYHADYPGWQVEVCPAQLLPHRPPSPQKHIFYDDKTVEAAKAKARALSPPRASTTARR